MDQATTTTKNNQLFGSSVAKEIKPQTRNLPQDIIIKVGRGGISNQGEGTKKGREHNIF